MNETLVDKVSASIPTATAIERSEVVTIKAFTLETTETANTPQIIVN